MKCKNCGFEISEDDKFCENCGCKIEKKEIVEHKNETEKLEDTPKEITKIEVSEKLNYQSNKEVKKEENKLLDKNKGNNTKIIIGVVIGILILFGGLFVLNLKPKDVQIEVGELYKSINEESDEFYSDNLFVHGYIFRDTRDVSEEKKGYYTLVSNPDALNNPEAEFEYVLFTIEEGLDENLGSGSEVTIKGKLIKEDENRYVNIVQAEELTVHNQVEPIHVFNSTSELIDQSDKYLNKTVKVLGKLIITNMSGSYVTDEKIVDSIWLYGISSSELFDVQQRGEWCIVTGKLILDGSTLAIEVENIEQNEDTDLMGLEFNDISIEYAERNFDKLKGKEVSIRGGIGQTLKEKEPGVYVVALEDFDTGKLMELIGNVPTVGDCEILVTGILEEKDSYIVLNVSDYKVIQQYGFGY